MVVGEFLDDGDAGSGRTFAGDFSGDCDFAVPESALVLSRLRWRSTKS
jgi:hypothetical protein